MMITYIEAILKVIEGAFLALSIELYECKGYSWRPSRLRQLWSLKSPRRLSRPWKGNCVAFLLLGCLLMGLFPVAFAGCAINPDSNGFVTIPASWTSIGENAFDSCSSSFSVVFDSGSKLLTIGDWAFVRSGLSGTITIPASVTSIGESAFQHCSSSSWGFSSSFSVVFDSGSQLQTIGNTAFGYSGLSGTITIPASVTSIGNTAFGYSGLSGTITIPASVTSIGQDAFKNCRSLTGVVFESGSQLQTLSGFGGSGLSGIITISASVTSIGQDAFSGCSSLTGVDFESGSELQTIGDRAFTNTGLSGNITIPASVTSIGYEAFGDCSSLTGVDFESGSQLQTLSGFGGSGLSGTITIPASVTSIGGGAFSGCSSLKTVVFESGSQLQTIGSGAYFGWYAFSQSGLSGTITIPALVTSIGLEAFSGCSSLTGVDFESGSQLQTIGEYAFQQSGLSGTITIPASVAGIGRGAFYRCSSLTTVVFESGYKVQSIAVPGDAFTGAPVDSCSCAGTACPAVYFSDVPVCSGCAIGESYSVTRGACLECPMKDGCLDGRYCAANYEGEGCAMCSPGYFVLNEACSKCPGTNIAVLLTLGLAFTAVFGVGAYYLSGKLINLAGLSTISIGHFQSITVFMSISFPIPDVFYDIARRIQGVFAFMYIDLFFSPECVSSFTFYEKWLLLTFIPIGLLLALYMWEGLQCRPSAPSAELENEALMADGDRQVPAIGMIEKKSEQALLESESDDQPVSAARGTELDKPVGGASSSGAPDTPTPKVPEYTRENCVGYYSPNIGRNVCISCIDCSKPKLSDVKNWSAPRAGWRGCWANDWAFDRPQFPFDESDPNWCEGSTLRKMFEERLNGSDVKEAVVSALLRIEGVDCGVMACDTLGLFPFPDAVGDWLNSWVTEVNRDMLNGKGYTCVLDRGKGVTDRGGNSLFVRIVKGVIPQKTEIDGAKEGLRYDAHEAEVEEMVEVPPISAADRAIASDEDGAVKKSAEEQEQSTSWLQCCCCCFYYCCSKICVPEFGRILNLGIVVFYIFILSQGWKIWRCTGIDSDVPTDIGNDVIRTHLLVANPSVVCFDDAEYWNHATFATIVILVCTYMPYKLYDNLRYELFSSQHSKLEHEKNMGFLYQKYKPEYWYWEPVVEMSRKWFLVFFSTFMPTGESQAAMDITITLVYWGLHAWCLPYRTDWKDEDGNPADPDLENNLQHYMYAIQILIVVTMSAHSSYSDNPNTGAAILLFFYFLGVVFVVYNIYKISMHQRRRNELVHAEDVEAGHLSKTTQALKKVVDGMGGQ